MAIQNNRHRKKGCFVTIIVLAIVAVIVLGGYFLVTNYLGKAQNKIYKAQYPMKYSEYVTKYSDLYGVDESLIYATIRTESHFDPDAKSGAGAYGLMQITEDALDFLKRNIPNDATDYQVSDLYNPETNIKFGTYFLSYLLDRYQKEKTAIAAYNAGFGNVDSWLLNEEYSSDGVTLSSIPFSETKSYVEKVVTAEKYYKSLYTQEGS